METKEKLKTSLRLPLLLLHRHLCLNLSQFLHQLCPHQFQPSLARESFKIRCDVIVVGGGVNVLNFRIPRPRAQRKFAQGVVIPSPPVTSYKSKPAIPVKVKNVPVPQYSPPAKRPKTEDFLTFLCYRGMEVLSELH